VTRQSRFNTLAASFKQRKGEVGPAREKKIAKSQDKDNYAKTTVYLSRDIYGDLQKALTDEKQEYSQLAEDLIREWLEKRRRPDVQTSKCLDVCKSFI